MRIHEPILRYIVWARIHEPKVPFTLATGVLYALHLWCCCEHDEGVRGHAIRCSVLAVRTSTASPTATAYSRCIPSAQPAAFLQHGEWQHATRADASGQLL